MTARTRDTLEPAVFDLPDTVDLASVNRAEIEVIRLATQGRLSPMDALRYIRMLDQRRRVFADLDFDARLQQAEQRLKERGLA